MANLTTTPFVPTSDDLLEFERQDADMDFGLSDPEIIKLYGGKIVAIWKKQVWGAGTSYKEALAQALERVAANPSTENPKRGLFVFVPVPQYSANAPFPFNY